MKNKAIVCKNKKTFQDYCKENNFKRIKNNLYSDDDYYYYFVGSLKKVYSVVWYSFILIPYHEPKNVDEIIEQIKIRIR